MASSLFRFIKSQAVWTISRDRGVFFVGRWTETDEEFKRRSQPACFRSTSTVRNANAWLRRSHGRNTWTFCATHVCHGPLKTSLKLPPLARAECRVNEDFTGAVTRDLFRRKYSFGPLNYIVTVHSSLPGHLRVCWPKRTRNPIS